MTLVAILAPYLVEQQVSSKPSLLTNLIAVLNNASELVTDNFPDITQVSFDIWTSKSVIRTSHINAVSHFSRQIVNKQS